MKVILYMAISVNGIIARENNDTSWVSQTEWESFRKTTQKVGNIIIGRRTFDVAVREGDFPFEGSFNVVCTSKDIVNKWGDNVVFVKSPQEALKVLEDRGFDTAMVGGGGNLNSQFMKENLVDEIYLDVEPIVLGEGISLFEDADFEAKLALIETTKLSGNEIQLRYKVEK